MDSSDVDLFITRGRQLRIQPLFFALKWINSCQLPSPFLNLCFYCCTVSLLIHLVIKSSSFSSSICGLLLFQTVQRPVVRQEENDWVKDFPLLSSSDDRNILKACGVGVENEWPSVLWQPPTDSCSLKLMFTYILASDYYFLNTLLGSNRALGALKNRQTHTQKNTTRNPSWVEWLL